MGFASISILTTELANYPIITSLATSSIVKPGGSMRKILRDSRIFVTVAKEIENR